jgi:hypothetical protein
MTKEHESSGPDHVPSGDGKKPYTKPRVVDYGPVTQIARGATSGMFMDSGTMSSNCSGQCS